MFRYSIYFQDVDDAGAYAVAKTAQEISLLKLTGKGFIDLVSEDPYPVIQSLTSQGFNVRTVTKCEKVITADQIEITKTILNEVTE
jgi:hypothetical protein